MNSDNNILNLCLIHFYSRHKYNTSWTETDNTDYTMTLHIDTI